MHSIHPSRALPFPRDLCPARDYDRHRASSPAVNGLASTACSAAIQPRLVIPDCKVRRHYTKASAFTMWCGMIRSGATRRELVGNQNYTKMSAVRAMRLLGRRHLGTTWAAFCDYSLTASF